MKCFKVEMELHEHHCLGDQTHLVAGRSLDDVDDDPASAWIPRGTKFDERNVSLLCSLFTFLFVYKPVLRFLARGGVMALWGTKQGTLTASWICS